MAPTISALIDLGAFRRNIEAIRRRVPPGTPLCPAVKANAYGHGIDLLLPVLDELKVGALAVAHLEEALQLRDLGWRRRILCLGVPTIGAGDADSLERGRAAVAAGLECTVSSKPELELLTQAARSLGRPTQAQIKVDTGMGRMGVLARDAAELVQEAARRPEIRLTGLYTHFGTADESDLTFAREQLSTLRTLADKLRNDKHPVPALHASNSAAIFRLAEAALDMVRPGLGIYGYWGGPPAERPTELLPIMRVVSRIVAVRNLPAGSSIGYGRTYHTARESVIGVVPIGYADGLRRALSNAGTITLEARRRSGRCCVPVVGRISMDLISLDITEVPDVRPGDMVTIYEPAPDAPNSVESVARQVGTIPYEITCALGSRVRRVAVKS